MGNARTALFNWLFARGAASGGGGGAFILRVEDTDVERSEERLEEKLLKDLRSLGLQWDEGPDVGGPRGPYRQSERRATYDRYTQDLLAGGHAYYCFCTEEELLYRIVLDKVLDGLAPMWQVVCPERSRNG